MAGARPPRDGGNFDAKGATLTKRAEHRSFAEADESREFPNGRAELPVAVVLDRFGAGSYAQ
jgi:hypothetical protein